MRKTRSGLILGVFVSLLVELPAEGQSFGPALWMRQAWADSTFAPLEIAAGPNEEVFVTGRLAYQANAWFEIASLGSGTPAILMLDPPSEGRGFFAGYDGTDGALKFVRSGSVLSGDNYGRTGQVSGSYGYGYSIDVVNGRVYHGEGPRPSFYRPSGAATIAVRDLQGELLHRIGPREVDFVRRSVFILGTGFDAYGHVYLAGTYQDTLYFSPDVVLAPSRELHGHNNTWDVFIASYARDGTVRWAHQIEDGGEGPLWVALGANQKAAFDVDAEGNMILGGIFYGGPPAPFDAAEDGVVLASYASDGTLAQVQALVDFGVAYEPTYSELRNDLGPLVRTFAGDYVAYPAKIRRDGSGNTYVLWGKAAVTGTSNALSVGDTTFYSQEERAIFVLTRFDAQGALSWTRKFEHDRGFSPVGMELTAEGHVYVWGAFWGHYLKLEGIELVQDEAEGGDGFLAHYDESGNIVRALHVTGPGYHSVETLTLGPSGDLYIAGRSTGDFVALNADTLRARGEYSVFVAKYNATSLSSKPSVEVPFGVIEATHYPNPFTKAATITYELPEASHVILRIYDILGREVTVLVDERKGAGSHSARLDASAWPSGVYLYRLEAGNQVATGRLVRRK